MSKHSKNRKFMDEIGQDSSDRVNKTGGGGLSYLSLPKGVEQFKEDYKVRAMLDFLMYKVRTKFHLDRSNKSDRAKPGKFWYKLHFRVHKNVGPNNQTVVCPTTFGKPCPVCKHRRKRKDKGASKDELKPMNYSQRNLYAVVPRGMKGYKPRLHIWNISQFAFQDKLDEELDEKRKCRGFCLPDSTDGKTLRIRFKKTAIGKKDSFNQCSRIDFKPREEDIDEELLNKVPNLEECLVVLDYDELSAMFFGEDDDDDDKKSKKRGRDDDDDDEDNDNDSDDEDGDEDDDDDDDDSDSDDEDDDDSDEDEDDDDEEDDDDDDDRKSSKSKSKKSKRGNRDRDDDDDEDEDEDEDDEEEDDEDDEDDDEEDDDKKSSKKSSKSKSSSGGKCPKGLRFGKDHEKKSFCKKCKKWEACLEAKE